MNGTRNLPVIAHALGVVGASFFLARAVYYVYENWPDYWQFAMLGMTFGLIFYLTVATYAGRFLDTDIAIIVGLALGVSFAPARPVVIGILIVSAFLLVYSYYMGVLNRQVVSAQDVESDEEEILILEDED